MTAATAGLYEVAKESLSATIIQVQYLEQRLQACNIAVPSPPGGRAVFLDMDESFRGCGYEVHGSRLSGAYPAARVIETIPIGCVLSTRVESNISTVGSRKSLYEG